MPKRLSIKFQKQPALVLHRVAFGDTKLVYVARANKRLRYLWGRSRIAYIGTTKRGARRIASSAVWKGADLLFEHGVRHLDLHMVTCGKRAGVSTWTKLERALIIRFRERYGSPPRANKAGKKMRWRDEQSYLKESRLDAILDQLG